jgi:hypothetical protein
MAERKSSYYHAALLEVMLLDVGFEPLNTVATTHKHPLYVGIYASLLDNLHNTLEACGIRHVARKHYVEATAKCWYLLLGHCHDVVAPVRKIYNFEVVVVVAIYQLSKVGRADEYTL